MLIFAQVPPRCLQGGFGKKKKSSSASLKLLRAENETRTRDPDLGKVVLYQLSYFRSIL